MAHVWRSVFFVFPNIFSKFQTRLVINLGLFCYDKTLNCQYLMTELCSRQMAITSPNLQTLLFMVQKSGV